MFYYIYFLSLFSLIFSLFLSILRHFRIWFLVTLTFKFIVLYNNICRKKKLLGQLLSYQIYQTTPFVQVIHNGCYRWQALTAYGCKLGEIFFIR